VALLDNKQVRDISYISKDFDSIKGDLMSYIKRHFPDDWQDFNEASGGMAVLEMIAFLGDQLSFYIDRQANEGFIARAVEEKNIYALSQSLGYKPRLEAPASVLLNVSATFTNTTSAASMFTVKKGSRVITNFDPVVSFELIEDVDFTVTANRTLVDDGTNSSISVSSVSAVAGRTRTFNYTAGDAVPFLKLTLPDEDITEITSVSSSDGFEWFEVGYLAQDTLFIGDLNTTTSSGDISHVMKYKRVPRRYTVERETGGRTSVRFGAGTLSVEDNEVIPNPDDFVLPATLRGSPSGFMPALIDSSSFLKTKTLGVAPRNVSLDITYRFGGGLDTNVGFKTITKFRDTIVEYNTDNFQSISGALADEVRATLAVANIEQASGGEGRETFQSIRENTANFFASQGRAVSLQDYQAITMTMPGSFGAVFRSIARKDPDNTLGVELVIASRNNDGQLVVPNGVLTNNIETYIKKFKSFSDSVKISNARIVNLGINFAVVPEQGINNNEALLAAFFLLRDTLDVTNTNFNDQIVIPDLVSKVQALQQVRSVAELRFFARTGTVDGRTYSNVNYDIKGNTRSGVLKFEPDMVWEIKFVQDDIVGRIA
jgi:hypothetical protein